MKKNSDLSSITRIKMTLVEAAATMAAPTFFVHINVFLIIYNFLTMTVLCNITYDRSAHLKNWQTTQEHRFLTPLGPAKSCRAPATTSMENKPTSGSGGSGAHCDGA